MSADVMDLDRFRRLLDAYGGAPARWPEGERRAALALCEGSTEARALAEAAATLDRALDRAPRPAPSAALVGAVLAARPVPAAGTGWWRRWLGPAPAWPSLAALLLAAVLGLGLGASGTLTPPKPEVVVLDIGALGPAGDGIDGEGFN